MITHSAFFSSNLATPAPINLNSVETIDSTGNAYTSQFNPVSDGFIATCGTMTNKQVIVYSWNGTDTLAEVETVNTGNTTVGMDWHPDGDFLAWNEIGDSTNSLNVYSWNGSDTLASADVVAITGGAGSACHWHPNGNFIAVNKVGAPQVIQVYSWNGTDTLTLAEEQAYSNDIYDMQWSPSGSFLAVVGTDANNEIQVYSWNGSDTLAFVDDYDMGGVSATHVVWSSDNSYLFVSDTDGGDPGTLWAFGFDGTNITLADSISNGTKGIRGIALYNDQYIATGIDRGSAASQVVLELYSWTVGTETLTLVDDYTTNARGMNMINFNSTGTYIACPTLTSSTSVTVRMISMY